MKDSKYIKQVIRKVQGNIDAVIKKYNLIQENDRIAVGVSGGIDSIVLLENLTRIKRIYFPNIYIEAVHIDLVNIPYKTDKNLLLNFCNKLKIPLQYIEAKAEINEQKIKNTPCFICSWNRRKILYQYTKNQNFNKLALGHNLNDLAETFLLNLLYNNSISTLPYYLKMFHDRLTIIRPMLELEKNIIKNYAKFRNLKIDIKTCLYDKKSKRKKLQNILNLMKEYVPNPEEKILKALQNIKIEYLPH